MSSGTEPGLLWKGRVPPPAAGQGDLWVNQTTNELQVHNGLSFASQSLGGNFGAGINVLAGAITMSDTASKIVPGATSFAIRNHADSADNLLVSDAGAVTIRTSVSATAVTATTGNVAVTAGALTFGAAASKVVPGATSLSLRNNADSADNLVVLDAGGATFRSTVSAGGVIESTTGGFKFPDGTTQGSALAGQNLLVNGGMEVFQRGGTVTANSAYAHDRWQVLLNGSSTISVTDETTIIDTGSGHSLKAVYAHNTASFIDQKLEHYLQLRGRTVTFAIKVRKGVASSVRPYISDSGVKTFGATSATTGSFTVLTVTLAIAAGATSVNVGVELSISDTVYLDNATLSVGSVAMDYVALTPADDLARCTRYYWELGGLNSTEYVMAMLCYTTTNAMGALLFPTEMAVAPTVTVSAASDWAILTAAGAITALTALAGASITRRDCRLTATVASGMVAGNASILLANTTTSARVTFEANP